MTTLDYYNNNAKAFSASTRDVSFLEVQDKFLSYLPEHAHILDFGCGSGRDTKYFLEQSYEVTAIDGSKELCKLASDYTGTFVKQMLFQDLSEEDVYDGIWACSSILHLNRADLFNVLQKMERAVKSDGIIYTSFKYGTFEGERNGRYFIDFTEETFLEFLKSVTSHLQVVECYITGDVRPGRGEEKWLNIILEKRLVKENQIFVRQETQTDRANVYQLVKEAFSTAEHSDGTEQDLVNALRKGDAFIPELSLVAIIGEKIVGYVLFTKATVGGHEVLALAPLAILPEYQRRGVGTALVEEGHRIAKKLGYDYSVVLGSENYYPRFGYRPAKDFGINVPEGFPEENFMTVCLSVDAPLLYGDMMYAPEFM